MGCVGKNLVPNHVLGQEAVEKDRSLKGVADKGTVLAEENGGRGDEGSV